MRRDEAKAVRATIEYQLSGKRLRSRPRKRWFDGVSQDLRSLDVEDWEKIIKDRERWKALNVAAKTLEEL
jgi:hypothetical protein